MNTLITNNVFNTYKHLRCILLPEIAAIIASNILAHTHNIFDDLLSDIDDLREVYYKERLYKISYDLSSKQRVNVMSVKGGSTICSYTADIVFSRYDNLSYDNNVLNHKNHTQRMIIKSNNMSILKMSGTYDNVIHVDRRIDSKGNIIQSKNKEKRMINKRFPL